MASGIEAEIEPGLKRVLKYQSRMLYPQQACLHGEALRNFKFSRAFKINSFCKETIMKVVLDSDIDSGIDSSPSKYGN